MRPTTDFVWQRNPFQLVGGGSGLIETAGIDYILPYWMARYYGVGAAFSVRSAAAEIFVTTPESLGSLFGSNLTTATATETAIMPWRVSEVAADGVLGLDKRRDRLHLDSILERTNGQLELDARRLIDL